MNRVSDERAFTRDILRLSRTYRREVDRALGPYNVSEARALPVLALARLGEGVRQGILAEALGVEGPSLVRLIDQLCADGLVERRNDPDDRRANSLHLTDAGRGLAGELEPAGDLVRDKMLAGVSDDDLAAAVRVLGTFGRNLEEARARPRSRRA